MAAQGMVGPAPAEDPMAALGMPPMDPAAMGGMPPEDPAMAAPEQGPDLEGSLAGIEEALLGTIDEKAMAEVRSHVEAIREIAQGGAEMSSVEDVGDIEPNDGEGSIKPEEEGDKKGMI